MLNRRNMLAMAPAVIIAAAPMSALADDGAQFLAWEREIARCDAEMAPAGTSDEDVDRLSNERHEWEHVIATTPTTSRTGMIVKARHLVDARRSDLDPYGADLASQLLHFVEAN